MKKIESTSHFRVGGIYNIVYVGSNTSYAHINGKRTIRVTAIEPKLKFVTLFDQFGDPLSKDLKSNEATCGAEPFKEDQFFEPDDQSEWFKKSTKLGSLQEALDQELITKDDIQRIAKHRTMSPFVAHMTGPKLSLASVSCLFHTSIGRGPKQPLLQSVYIVWTNWEELKIDFERQGFKLNF